MCKKIAKWKRLNLLGFFFTVYGMLYIKKTHCSIDTYTLHQNKDKTYNWLLRKQIMAI